MSSRTRQAKAKAPDSPGTQRTPAAVADNAVALSAGATLPAWSDSPRQLKQAEQLTQLQPATAPASHGGLPENLRSGIEALSGIDMSSVRVHRNSSKPAALQAHAYAQGQDIHLGPGQERHLPHEAWHVVQQAQGRVRPTMQPKTRAKTGPQINNDPALEREADLMGAKALQPGSAGPAENQGPLSGTNTVQLKLTVANQVVDYATAEAALKQITGRRLTEKDKPLLRSWTKSWGPISLGSLRLYSGVEKNYPNYDEVLRALRGETASASNLKMETELAKTIPSNERLQAALSRLAQKIHRHVEDNKTGSLQATGKKSGGGEFWSEAKKSYRGLWNFIGEPYNLNNLSATWGAFASGGRSEVPEYKPNAFQNTLSDPSGDMVDAFASIKQVSNVYNDRVGKTPFKTPSLNRSVVKGKEKFSRAKLGQYTEHKTEKRYNTQSLNESDAWTKYARQHSIPVSAGASGSMDRMYKLAAAAGATDLELIALALAGHFVFNQVYTRFSRDPHTFFEIMDVLHPYLKEKIPTEYPKMIRYVKTELRK